MTDLWNLKLAEAPRHDVLPGAAAYDLRRLTYSWGTPGGEDSVLEIDLSSHAEYLTLRFDGVQDLRVACGEPMSAVGILILDTRQYVPEMPGAVRVQHPKGDDGALSFWADRVAVVYRKAAQGLSPRET